MITVYKLIKNSKTKIIVKIFSNEETIGVLILNKKLEQNNKIEKTNGRTIIKSSPVLNVKDKKVKRIINLQKIVIIEILGFGISKIKAIRETVTRSPISKLTKAIKDDIAINIPNSDVFFNFTNFCYLL
jgi:hypothetical protein